MAELADAQDLGSCGVLRAGSSPVTRTKQKQSESSPSWRQIRICLFIHFIIEEIWFYKLFSQKHSSYSLNDNSSINSDISNPNSFLYIFRKSMDAL